MRLSESAAALLIHACREYAPWLPSCMTQNPTPAMASASDVASGKACHQVVARKTSARYDAVSHTKMVSVLRYMRAQSRRSKPLPSK